MPTPSLPDLQSSFFRSIARAPRGDGGTTFDPGVLQVVEGRSPLGPAERLDIYAQMYWARILDALAGDFPKVAAILGRERFDAVARAYLAENPSTHPSLRYAGRGLPVFLAQAGGGDMPPFLADLARLEWARLEVFDAPDAAPIATAELGAIPPAEWPALRFLLVPAVEILRSDWPVHEIWAAAESGAPGSIGPAKTWLRVWRDGFTVYQASMDALERSALERVHAGEPFAAICAALTPALPPAEAAREAGGLLLRWVEDGILVCGDSPASCPRR